MRTDIRLFKLDRYDLPDPAGYDAASQIDVPHALLAAGVDLGGRAVAINSHAVSAELAPKMGQAGSLVRRLEPTGGRARRFIAAIF